MLPISPAAKRKAAKINGIDAIDEAVILFELECKTTVILRNDTPDLQGFLQQQGIPYDIPDVTFPKVLDEKKMIAILQDNGWKQVRSNSHKVYRKHNQQFTVPRIYTKNTKGEMRRQFNAKEESIA